MAHPAATFKTILSLLFFMFVVLLIEFHPNIQKAQRIRQQIQSTAYHHLPFLVPEVPHQCPANVTHLRALQLEYGLVNQVQYAERYIQYRREMIPRSSITRVDGLLFPAGFETIDIHNSPKPKNCIAPLKVTVPISPYPRTVNASGLLFGISVSTGSLIDRNTIKEWSYWLTDGNGKSNGAELVVDFVGASDTEIYALKLELKELGIEARVYGSDSTTRKAQRSFSLLGKLQQHSSMNVTKWLVLSDYDTFFPSMHGILEKLATFNHTKEVYIGALSEDDSTMKRYASPVSGGAGLFISVPLASKIVDLSQKCTTSERFEISVLNRTWEVTGEALIHRCINENTAVRLTALPELHSLDIHGDPSGFYENGLKTLSIHHYKGGKWHHLKPKTMVGISNALGEDGFLLRFQTEDNFIISAGYSVVKYPKGIDFDTSQMEGTFMSPDSEKEWSFDYVFGPLRSSMVGTGKKLTWELVDSELVGDPLGNKKAWRETYFRERMDGKWWNDKTKMQGREGVDAVVVLNWAEG